MIPLKFYRDDEYVYINNPDGTTKRVPIEDFESAISGEGGSSGSGGGTTVVNFVQDPNSPTTVKTDKTYSEIRTAMQSGYVVGVYGVGTQFMVMPLISLVDAYEGVGGSITVNWYGSVTEFFAQTDDDYPSYTFN